MPEKIQPSFAKGELSPELHGRVDTAAYQVGLASARNTVIHTYGGVSRRHGTTFIAPVKDHTKPPRLIEFQFKTTDTYVLEFGDQYLRFIRDDGHVVEDAVTITGATQADPVVITATAHGYANGDEVFISGVSGMIELNGNRYVVANVAANTFELTDQVTGTNIDGTGFTAYVSGGEVARIYEIVTPYLQADLMELNFVQSADVMTIVHQDYDIRELSRFDHDDWTLAPLSLGPTIAFPVNGSVIDNTTGSETRYYKVTAINEDGEESLSHVSANSRVITNITQANPAVVTISSAYSTAAHDSGEFYIEAVNGMTEVNGKRFQVNPLGGGATFTTFQLVGIDSTAFSAYTSGGVVTSTYEVLADSAAAEDNTISWDAVVDADRYAIYRSDIVAGGYGLIGETTATSFLDNNITPDTSESPPISKDPFIGPNDQPGAVGFYEQRRVFGGSFDKPDTSIFSQTANFSNFNIRNPLQSDDAITATLNSNQVNEIRAYVGLNDLLVFTSGSEFRINSGPDSIFAPDTLRIKPQTSWGSSYRPPLVVGNVVLFVTDNLSDVRTIGYSLEIDGYNGSNINILSRHLTEGYSIIDWSLQRHPESRIYMIRNDGKVLTLTYDQEQEVIAWTPWDTKGWFERVCTLRGGGPERQDSTYFVVKRLINGNTVRYIEVYRQFTPETDVRDCYYVDCGGSVDNPLAITDVTATNPVVVTVPSHGLTNGDEIDIFDIIWEPTFDEFETESQPDQLNTRRYLVANVTTDTFELTDLDGNDIDGTGFQAYVSGGTIRTTFSTVLGLSFLEGRAVKVLADGNVISNLTVTDGSITLPRSFSRVHVGLSNTADVELLNIEAPQGTIQGYMKKVAKVLVRFYRSRGMFIGPDKDHLVEMKQREFEAMGDPTDLLTGDKSIILENSWNTNGRVFMRQKEPLPMRILAVVPTFDVGAQE